MSGVDILGLLAGITVSISLVMRRMGWLRIINLLGCILFIIWGLLEGALGVWIANAFGALVNIYRFLEHRGVIKQRG